MFENQNLAILVIICLLTFFAFLYFNDKRLIRTFLSIIIIMEGFAIILLPNKSTFLFGIFLIIFGASLSFFSVKDNLSNIHKSLFSNYEKYFTNIGIILLSSILIINFIILKNEFGQIDLLGSIVALYFIIFKYIPNEFNKEKEIMFLFLNFTLIFFTMIAAIYVFGYNNNVEGDWNYNELMVNFFLAKPLGNFLSLLGYDVLVDRDTLIYYDLTLGHTQRVWIADDCSGIYSMLIFISLYISFIIVDYKKLDYYSTMFFIIGVMTAYFANILRMAVIVLAGHYWGEDALQWAHINVGWLIFTFWILLFWIIIINILDVRPFNIGESDTK